MFNLLSNLMRSNNFITSNARNLHSFITTTKNKVPTFLSTKTPIIEQVAQRTTIIHVPDWNFKFKRSGPRGKHFKPNVMKRVATHGLEARLETRGGKQILWRKILKGPKGWVSLVPGP